MGIALLLEQGRIFALLAWFRAFALHVRQIERGRMGAAHETDEIRSGQKGAAVKFPHQSSNTFIIGVPESVASATHSYAKAFAGDTRSRTLRTVSAIDLICSSMFSGSCDGSTVTTRSSLPQCLIRWVPAWSTATA
jgi:hypothetical protein